ncbi:MAG: (d)CMP kinase [Bacteroidia bacterium]|nr:(d)CMP kinase [Bacteroidia bacterium]
MKKITIAIDGYSSCGKSTLAKALAARLSYSYVDSGAMYRAVALFAIKHGYIKEQEVNENAIIHNLNRINIWFKYNPFSKTSETYLNGENVEKEIRQLTVSNIVSKVSAIKEVRKKMVAIQQEMGQEKGVVMDGRDIGTTVFPHAEIKLFMTADSEVRTQRRLFELKSKGEQVTADDIRKNLERRDYDDTHRKESPLTKAKDAVLFDNSDLTQTAQLEYALKLIKDFGVLVEDIENIA